MSNAIIYTRVSTKNQAEEGYSLAGQEKDCKIFAEMNNYSVSKVFVEKGESAKTQDRTELQNLMKFCVANKKNIDAIIIWKIDRLTRDVKDFYNLQDFFAKLNIKVLFARENNGDSAGDKLTRNLMGVLAQYENDQKSERVTNGMKTAFLQGHWMWKAPIGYLMKNGNVEPDPKTAHHIKKIFKLFSTGLYQQTQIIKIMADDGLKINTNRLCRLLKNPIYSGYIYKKGWSEEPIRGIFEPLISEAEFKKVQDILNGKKPVITAHKRNNPEFPLRQFITCPNCNQPLTGSKSKGRKERYAYYHCHHKDCCINFRIRKEKLEKIFVDYLKFIKPEQDLLNLFETTVKDAYNEKLSVRLNSQKQVQDKLIELKNRKSKLIDFRLDGTISEEDYKFKTEQLSEEIQENEFRLREIDEIDNNLCKCLKYACKAISNIDTLWINGDLDLKQRLQRLIFPKGLMYSSNDFRTAEISSLFIKKDTLEVSYINMVPPSEFESLSTP